MLSRQTPVIDRCFPDDFDTLAPGVQSLNLRDETPVSEEPAGAPPEEPLGLDLIRAWLAKPRPRLYRLWLWAPVTAKGIRKAYGWLRANTGPALRHAAKTARKAGEAARALRGVTKRLADWFRNAFPPGSRGRAFGVHLTEATRQFGGAAIALLGIGRRLERFSPRPLPEEAPAEPAGPSDPSLDGPEPAPKPLQQTEPEEEAASPGRLLPRPRGGGRKEPARKDRPAPETRRPTPTDSQPPSGAPTDLRAAALAELPESLRVCILTLGRRPRKAALRYAIWRILDETGPAMSEAVGLLLDMDSANLVKRHLSPLVKEGVLARTIPEQPRHPNQAYRSTGRPPG